MQYTPKKIWIITYPVLISLLMEHLIGVTDTAFMGRVGEIELGASAIAGVYYMVLFMLGFGFSIGAEILMARRNGERQYKAIGNIFFQGILMLMVIAAVVLIFSYTVSPSLLKNIIASPAILDATLAYTNLRIWGLFFAFTSCMFRAFYMATTRTHILTLNSIVMVISNVIFNYILVFGKFGFPAMGIAGAAIGSTLAEFISASFFILYTRFRTDHRKYGIFRITRLSGLIQKQIINVSGWTTVQYFLSAGTWLFFFLAIEHLGERQLAVSNIVRNTSSFFFMIVSAFASTGTAIVSNMMGRNRSAEVLSTIWKIMKMCIITILPLFIIAFSFPGIIMRIFTDNTDLIASAIPSMRVMLTGYILHIPGYILFFAISGTGNTKHAFYIELVSLAVYASYVFFMAMGLKADIAVCWTSDMAYSIILLCASYIYLKRVRWQNKKI